MGPVKAFTAALVFIISVFPVTADTLCPPAEGQLIMVSPDSGQSLGNYTWGRLPVRTAGVYSIKTTITVDNPVSQRFLYIPQRSYPMTVHINGHQVYRWADPAQPSIKASYAPAMAQIPDSTRLKTIEIRFRTDGLTTPVAPVEIGTYEAVFSKYARGKLFNSTVIESLLFIILAISFMSFYYAFISKASTYMYHFALLGVFIFFTYSIFLWDDFNLPELPFFKLSRISLTLIAPVLLLAVLTFSNYYLKKIYVRYAFLPIAPIIIYIIIVPSKAALVDFYSHLYLFYITPLNIISLSVLVYAATQKKRKETYLIIGGIVIYLFGALYDIYFIHTRTFPPIWLSSYTHTGLFFTFIASIGLHIKEKQEKLQSYSIQVQQALDKRHDSERRMRILLRKQDNFMKALAHELRTPLSALLGTISSMKLEAPERHNLSNLNTSANHLALTVTNLFYYEKIKDNSVTLSRRIFNPRNLTEDIIGYYTPRAELKKNQIMYRVSPSVPQKLTGDDEKIAILLDNLLSNAVKFTELGKISLRMHYRTNMLKIRISDTGCGIGQETRHQIFKEFHREEELSRSQKYDGLGIGLSIVKKLLNTMGGTMRLRSKKGVGTIFSVAVPAEPAHAVPNQHDRKAHTILIAEDDPVNRESLARILEKMNMHPVTAENGFDALRLVDEGKTKVDAVLMDIQMPVLDGISATKEIHKIIPNLPIIALTANASHAECLEAGMAAHITKPPSVSNIINTINAVLLRQEGAEDHDTTENHSTPSQL
ncbi:MAG: response regulator [Fibrobacterota bacterium]